MALDLNCSRKNFPLRSFYNEFSCEILLFYRRGESFRISVHDIEKYEFEEIFDGDLGQLAMYKDIHILLAQSSNKVIFFKLTFDEILKKKTWKVNN